jgi:VanZ family protein
MRWLLWSAYVTAWTTALITPVRLSSSWHITEIDFSVKFFFTKGLHVSAYAVMAALTGWVSCPVRWRWLLMFVLMAHGPITEQIQEFVGRDGNLRDVLFDMFGIAIGLLISWRWWTATADR